MEIRAAVQSAMGKETARDPVAAGSQPTSSEQYEYEEGTRVQGPDECFVGTLTENVLPKLARVETDDVPGGVIYADPARLEPVSNAGRRI
jgi:hypothetical protein